VKLTGHEEGIAQLKALHVQNKDAIKFLVEEARTNTDLTSEFRGQDGVLYRLQLDLRTGDLVVSLAPSQRPSSLPGPASSR